MLTPADWHQRYLQQAGWTQAVRRYLYQQAGIQRASRVLEVGCGTGVITGDLHASTPAQVFGIDLRLENLGYAKSQDTAAAFCAANALSLPFPDGAFDITLCHFFLLWVKEPELALSEMARVTRPGGALLALAEPDYGGRIDFPADLAELGRLQAEALERQGANPRAGRMLGGLLRGAGLREVEVGLLGGQWRQAGIPEGWETEWRVLENDLQGRIPAAELRRYQALDRQAWETGERILFVPTFYGWGRKD